MEAKLPTNFSGAGGTSGTPVGVLGETPAKGNCPREEVSDATLADGNQRIGITKSVPGITNSVQGTDDSMMNEEIAEDTEDVQRRNVKLTFPIRKGSIYSPAEILKGVLQLVPAEKVVGLGVLSAITEWNLLLHDVPSANALIRTRNITLEDGTSGIATQVGTTEAIVRVQWLPMSVPDEKIRSLLEPYGKIEDFAWEVYADPELAGLRNGVRRIRLTLNEGFTKEDLPHRTKLESDQVLLTVFGRRPRCLRCGLEGHFFKNCPRRGRNQPTFADKVREPPKITKESGPAKPILPVVPGPVLEEVQPPAEDTATLQRRYEEEAIPLLKELKSLTSEEPETAKLNIMQEPKVTRMEPMPMENEKARRPQEMMSEDLPKRDPSKKRPRAQSPPSGSLWADQIDSDGESIESSHSSRRSTASMKTSSCLPKDPVDSALGRLLAQRARIMRSTEHMDSAQRARVLEVLEYFGDDMLDICGFMPPGTTFKKFRKRNHGIYQELRRIERLYEDYREAKMGPVDPDILAAAMEEDQ